MRGFGPIIRPIHIDEMLRGGVQMAALTGKMSPRTALEDAARQAQEMLDEVNELIRSLNQ